MPTAHRWVGWYRARGARAWVRVARAVAWADAWQALLSEIADGRTGEWVVLMVGDRP